MRSLHSIRARPAPSSPFNICSPASKIKSRYTAFTIDEITLPRQKEAAVGIPGAQEWVNDLPNEQNKRFVADYRKKHPGLSPTFYGAQTYDAAMCGRDEGRPFRQGSSAQGHGKGRLRVRARQVQVR